MKENHLRITFIQNLYTSDRKKKVSQESEETANEAWKGTTIGSIK